jgi:hypothetical protein
MPVPTQDFNHVVEGQGLLTEHFKRAPVVLGILRALLLRLQDKENDLYLLLNAVQLANHPLPGGPWQILDQLGAIVGIKRDGRNDADYLAAIKIKIRINRSHGLAEDIIDITALVVAAFTYREWYPAAFEVEALDIAAPVALALTTYLGEAKSAGVAGFLRYSTWASPPGIIMFSSTLGGITGAGFQDVVSGQFPNAFVSFQELP